MRAAIQAGRPFVPVLRVAWPSGTKHYGVSPRAIGGYPLDSRVIGGGTVSGGGIPIKPGSLSFPEVSVELADTDGEICALLEGGTDPRGVAVSLIWAMPGEVETDWFVLFDGVLDRGESGNDGYSQTLYLRANDTPLHGNSPKAQFLPAEFSKAPAPTWNTFCPIVYGSHSGLSLTNTGMVLAICWSYDLTEGYRYTPTLGFAKDVARVYVNGVLVALGTDYGISYPIRGGKQLTSIDLNADPGPDAIITCDIDGIEDVGDGSGALVTNVVDEFMHRLANFGFGDWRHGLWNDPEDYAIDLVSSARAAEFASAFLPAGSGRFGGGTQAEQIEQDLQKFFSTCLAFRPYWTETGQLGIAIFDHRFQGYTSPGFASPVAAVFLRGRAQQIGLSFDDGGDTSNLIRRVDLEALKGLDTDGRSEKLFQSISVEDVAQTEDRADSYVLEFSESRAV